MDEHLQRERENRGIVLMIRWEKGYVDIYYIIFMQNQIFMDTRTEEMDFFRPLSRAFFRIQTLDKCINIRLESCVCIRMKIPAVRFCIKDRIIDLKNSEKNGTRKVYGDRISPYMFIKRSISRKICNVRSSSMKLFNEFILLLNRCIIKEHSGKIKSCEKSQRLEEKSFFYLQSTIAQPIKY